MQSNFVYSVNACDRKSRVAPVHTELVTASGVKPGKGLDQNLVTPRKALGNINKENQGLKGLKQGSANPLKPLKLADNTNLITPRRALGNINKDPRAASIKTPSLKPSCNPGSLKPENIKKFNKASNDLGKKQKTVTPQLKLATLSAIPTCRQVEDIEQMYIPSPDDQEDDYEDIMPKSERISTYISRLISWRPPCFGDFPFSDDEEERSEADTMKRRDDIINRLGQNLPSHDLIEPEGMSEEEFFSVEPIEDIPLPSLASISASAESFPGLDDSVDIVTGMGTLQLRDLSPCLNT
ncbi:uncharacterized protein LOC125659515 isoform X2 [Ostrea edulis]|uniref:uncharacterized protein LOC125659515 isoform X2 n=1 Tax=Ostrea edulis TaxID=37623 RepID=UPI002095ED27|nr:uncharacterized protein LOC125659515 isoform X2 [Ostrea edulis]